MNQISILGCGWLGFPLAKSLLEKGFKINGSTTSEDKISILRRTGIVPFEINLLEEKIEGEIELFLDTSAILIVDIPPKLRGNSAENFVAKIQNLIPFIEKSSIKNVLFISSTGVYSDGFPYPSLIEENTPKPDSESGKQLLEVESILLKNTHFNSIILRFGGLIGEDRHPIKFLSGRKNIENPDGPINLIHQRDCIGIIETILQNKEDKNAIWDQVYNAVYPLHPSRKDYYTLKAERQKMALPEFDFTKPSFGKIIKSDKLKEVLHYKFLEMI